MFLIGWITFLTFFGLERVYNLNDSVLKLYLREFKQFLIGLHGKIVSYF